MSEELLLMIRENQIITLSFNRPKALNALNASLLDDLGVALDKIAADRTIRVLILTGTGEKAFIAGADISELAVLSPLGAKQFAEKGRDVLDKIEALPIPVIAAVNGFALGGGNEIALACDFIYASTTAKFGFPEINLGLIPGFGGTQRASRRIGINLAREMIFTGKIITAEEALGMGMVNKVCLPDRLMEEVKKTAAIMAAKGKVSLRAAKQAINKGINVDLKTGCHIETDAFSLCFSSPDAKEGTTAFLEKRPPHFKGDIAE